CVESRRRQCFHQANRLGFAQSTPGPSRAAEHGQATTQRDDLSPRPALRGVKPSALPFLKLEEDRDDLPHVLPVTRIVRLQEELTARQQRTMDEGQESRRNEPALDLARIIIRLRMITVDLRDAARLDVPL